jgi:predicted metalloprotease with PDZ domain
MRVVWKTHGRELGHELPEGAFEELASEVTGLDLGEFFRNGLRTTVDPPVGILLAQFGVKLNLRAALGQSDAGGTASRNARPPRPWLGLRTRTVNGRVRITHVLDGGPAQQSGLVADDEIVALHGLRVDPEALDGMLDRLPAGESVEMYLFRREELLRVQIVPAEAPRDTCYLMLDDQASEQALARRREWLTSPGAR